MWQEGKKKKKHGAERPESSCMARLMCDHLMLRSQLQTVLCIKYVRAAVIFVKISSPQISAGTGLNLSHEQVSQSLSFAAKLGIGKTTFFSLRGRLQKETKALGQNARQHSAPWGEWMAAHYADLHPVSSAQRKG